MNSELQEIEIKIKQLTRRKSELLQKVTLIPADATSLWQATSSSTLANSTLVQTPLVLMTSKSKQTPSVSQTYQLPKLVDKPINVLSSTPQSPSRFNEAKQLSRHQQEQFHIADVVPDHQDENFALSNLQQHAKQYWNITEFRPYQERIISATLAKHDVLGILSTGSGKSLCYQLPAIMNKPKVTVVVSPLISLITDQVTCLNERGVRAISLSSSHTSKTELKFILSELNNGNRSQTPINLLYVTHEKLSSSSQLMNTLRQLSDFNLLDRFAIDECHCCSEFGHDFRPDYAKLSVLRFKFPHVPILALTATCPAHVVPDIRNILQLNNDTQVVSGPLNRLNLIYSVTEKPSNWQASVKVICAWLKEHAYCDSKGIIYCLSKKDCEQLQESLKKFQLKCAVYHSSITDLSKDQVHTKWRTDQVNIIIATVAFGLGINNPNVRFVIHHSTSKSLESYYQESGRAGRDGNIAHCMLMFRAQDAFKLTGMVCQQKDGLTHAYQMLRYCLNVDGCCRRQLIRQHFASGDDQFINPWCVVPECFDANECNGNCDICQAQSGSEVQNISQRDMSGMMYLTCRYMIWAKNKTSTDNRGRLLAAKKLTLKQLADILNSSDSIQEFNALLVKQEPVNYHQAVVSELYPASGSKSSWSTSDISQCILYMLLEGYLIENHHFTKYSSTSYLLPSELAQQFCKAKPNQSMIHRLIAVPKKGKLEKNLKRKRKSNRDFVNMIELSNQSSSNKRKYAELEKLSSDHDIKSGQSQTQDQELDQVLTSAEDENVNPFADINIQAKALNSQQPFDRLIIADTKQDNVWESYFL